MSNEKFKLIAIGIIFLLIGYIIGYHVGQYAGLNWCANKAIDFLNAKGIDVTLNADRIRTVVTAYFGLDPNGTGRINMFLNRLG